MNKTDLRIIKTLRQIDTALLENLKEHPFQKITIDMLCKSALINRSTFYKYYEDKYDLLERYVQRVLQDFKPDCAERNADRWRWASGHRWERRR